MSIQVSETKLFDVVFAEISYSRECLQLLNMDILWNCKENDVNTNFRNKYK
jgi:hypothetical protein